MVTTRMISTSVIGLLAAMAASVSAAGSTNPELIAYVVDWELPANIQWSKLDHVIYSFAEPDQSGKLGNFNTTQLEQVVQQAHANNVGVSLSVGGWTGSRYISDILGKSSSSFATTILDAVKQYSLDASLWMSEYDARIPYEGKTSFADSFFIAFKEFPNSQDGMTCNTHSAQDLNNYLALLKSLRQGLGNKLITLATGTTPFNDQSGNPAKDLSDFASTYDINGNWDPTTGPNSPLKAASQGESASVESAMSAWKSAGIPSKQLSVGAAFYGWTARTITNTAQSQYVRFSKTQIKGDQYDTMSADPCPGASKSYSGEMQWRSIDAQGIDAGRNGWTVSFDKTTQTPWAFSARKKQIVTYDNAQSLEAKAQYAKQQGSGAFIWSLEMDDPNHTLLNALQGVRA
ncbi:hypothetical protein NQZ79_g8730 [Umbelopsis isabellina]|nr:hypothetical protein NQZ79_g8730 [Umbelopsis isabellina]